MILRIFLFATALACTFSSFSQGSQRVQGFPVPVDGEVRTIEIDEGINAHTWVVHLPKLPMKRVKLMTVNILQRLICRPKNC